jgi:DNA-binding response OmpR family regulator
MSENIDQTKCSIAHLDDDDIVHFLSKRIFTRSCARVSYMPFSSGFKLLPELNSGGSSIDAVLVDLDMPVMSGWNFLDELKKTSHNKPVFILTSSDCILDRMKAKEYEFVIDYFLKPLTPDHVSKICKYRNELQMAG